MFLLGGGGGAPSCATDNSLKGGRTRGMGNICVVGTGGSVAPAVFIRDTISPPLCFGEATRHLVWGWAVNRRWFTTTDALGVGALNVIGQNHFSFESGKVLFGYLSVFGRLCFCHVLLSVSSGCHR